MSSLKTKNFLLHPSNHGQVFLKQVKGYFCFINQKALPLLEVNAEILRRSRENGNTSYLLDVLRGHEQIDDEIRHRDLGALLVGSVPISEGILTHDRFHQYFHDHTSALTDYFNFPESYFKGTGRHVRLHQMVIKGAGRNASSVITNYLHSWGGSNLREGLKEIIHSHLIDSATPLGCWRSIALAYNQEENSYMSYREYNDFRLAQIHSLWRKESLDVVHELQKTTKSPQYILGHYVVSLLSGIQHNSPSAENFTYSGKFIDCESISLHGDFEQSLTVGFTLRLTKATDIENLFSHDHDLTLFYSNLSGLIEGMGLLHKIHGQYLTDEELKHTFLRKLSEGLVAMEIKNTEEVLSCVSEILSLPSGEDTLFDSFSILKFLSSKKTSLKVREEFKLNGQFYLMLNLSIPFIREERRAPYPIWSDKLPESFFKGVKLVQDDLSLTQKMVREYYRHLQRYTSLTLTPNGEIVTKAPETKNLRGDFWISRGGKMMKESGEALKSGDYVLDSLDEDQFMDWKPVQVW